MKNIFKSFKSLSILLMFIIMLCGCTSNNSIMNYNSKEFVDLYDYTIISIDYDYTQINDDDIENIITTELTCHEAYVPVKNRETIITDDILLLSIDGEKEYYIVGSGGFSNIFDETIIEKTIGNNVEIAISENETIILDIIGIYRNATIEDEELILDYYGYTDFVALEKFIRERAYKEIVFNYVYDIICEKTTISRYPEEIIRQISKDIDVAKNFILEEYTTMDEYLDEQDISYEDFKNTFASFYNDCMLYKAILDSKGMRVTQKEIDEYSNEKNLDDYEIYKEISEEKVRDIIVSNAVINTVKQ